MSTDDPSHYVHANCGAGERSPRATDRLAAFIYRNRSVFWRTVGLPVSCQDSSVAEAISFLRVVHHLTTVPATSILRQAVVGYYRTPCSRMDGNDLLLRCRYFTLYNTSPFERVLGEAGGSLMLAVINGSVSYPADDKRPPCVRDLISYCLELDPSRRPNIADVIVRSKAVLQTVRQQQQQQQQQQLRPRDL